MFTGIIRKTGEITKISSENRIKEIEIACPKLSNCNTAGDSIAIDGVCLTITKLTDTGFCAQIMPETLTKTIIGNYSLGTVINIEEPLTLGGKLDGHLVSGHVDYTGTIINIQNQGSDKDIEISFPPEMSKYLALKGSITVNGASLTISKLNFESFIVSLIPETLNNTNLGLSKIHDKVNIEIDLISRYLESLLKEKEKTTEYDFLKERGFI